MLYLLAVQRIKKQIKTQHVKLSVGLSIVTNSVQAVMKQHLRRFTVYNAFIYFPFNRIYSHYQTTHDCVHKIYNI